MAKIDYDKCSLCLKVDVRYDDKLYCQNCEERIWASELNYKRNVQIEKNIFENKLEWPIGGI